ncbi:MAG TPA: DUF5723 family protein [Saprospiraceae bacterium]|nr:DUF5723 family protein [Saprospiraceae bacterium]HMQ81257.1 DUF5723 family protein [Saprospiraceae bacterium]
MSKQSLLIFSLLVTVNGTALAQEQLGLRLSNYSGINSTIINPAYHTTAPFNWDINLLEGAFHASNNYVYIEETGLLDLYRNGEKLNFLIKPDLDSDVQLGPNDRLVDFDNNSRKRFGNILSSVMGPSFFVAINPQHRIGLITKWRFWGSSQDIPTILSYYSYDEQKFFNEFSIDPFRGAAATWAELGLNYAYTTETSAGNLSLGITAKYLMGYEAAFVRNVNSFQYEKLPGDSISSLSSIQLRYGFTDSNLSSDNYNLTQNGSGVAFDLGMVFTVGAYDGGAYDWKFGVSLIDIGRINFNKNAQLHELNGNDVFIVDTEVYKDFDSAEDFEAYIQDLSAQTLGDQSATLAAESFKMALPMAFSLQADRALSPHFYVGAAFTQGFPIGDASIRRGSLLAVAPRFESRWFDAMLPISYYNWEDLRLGLSVRLAFLTLGSDHLGSIFTRSDFYGTDFYVALKFNPFKIGQSEKGQEGRSGAGSRGRGAGGGNGRVKCYQF